MIGMQDTVLAMASVESATTWRFSGRPAFLRARVQGRFRIMAVHSTDGFLSKN
jgi:hypothetical protein